LRELKSLTQLRNLLLVFTKVTDEGVKALKLALPKCDVVK
jgi:hypothetical protein